MMYWLFVNADKIAEWGSLESFQSQARSVEGSDLSWSRAESGPQGNGPHWYARGAVKFGVRRDYLIVGVEEQPHSA